jgi:hypothetical protein
MNVLILVLRIIHIGSGVFWAGSAMLAASFIEPTVRKSGPDGAKFMQALARAGYARAMFGAGILTVLAGLSLYWIASGGLRLAWITTPQGLTLGLGGLTAITALGVGYFVQFRTIGRLQALGGQVQAAGGAPTPEQGAEMAAAAATLRSAGVWNAGLLGFTVLCMAAAQELFF